MHRYWPLTSRVRLIIDAVERPTPRRICRHDDYMTFTFFLGERDKNTSRVEVMRLQREI